MRLLLPALVPGALDPPALPAGHDPPQATTPAGRAPRSGPRDRRRGRFVRVVRAGHGAHHGG
ncbi:hypothetical protein GCM10011374_41510 [Kocuria dechangensis]|uniref:Uncharacterized protein n=1 Tax=Kocuria dechangensis TaxID=1176249 RepID=A0A917H9Z4_9MICC|nr:hypothetical protein GCM10011374_41510 [Kocuria dechangensis]